MSDRSTFWPAPPEWTRARIEAGGVTVTATLGDCRVFLLSGPGEAVSALAAPHLGSPSDALLSMAPDRAMLITKAEPALSEGWDPSGVAVSDLSDAHVRIDICGPGAGALLRRASPSLALSAGATPQRAALGFAGVSTLFQPLAEGVRIHVDRPQAVFIWHWLLAATSQTEDIP